MRRTPGRQRVVPLAEVRRILEHRRRAATARAGVSQSARNRFAGIVTKVKADGVAAVVEVQAGPHRLVSLMTAEAVEELGLRVGDPAVCVVKATNVVVEVASPRGRGP
jgi:molybdopterin-binding protein